MINSKEDLAVYLKRDQIALNKSKVKKPRFKHDIIWKYQILLRKCEYYHNCRKDFLGILIGKFLKLRFVILGQKLGFSIPLNVFGPGLSIAHYGYLVVNSSAKIGENCRIHEGVTIGASRDSYWVKDANQLCPQIGNNVFIATGAKILGNIKIADGVVIGANSVVTSDVLESNITVGGIPARKISNKNSDKFIIRE